MADGANKTFFISYAGPDEDWAEWIAIQLAAADYKVVLQAWDFVPGADFLHGMQEAVETADRTIAVLSPAYSKSLFGATEWQAAFAKDPTGKRGLLVPVRVKPCEPPALLASRIFVDLVGCGEEDARERLLSAVGGKRARPTSAAFPGRVSADDPPIEVIGTPAPSEPAIDQSTMDEPAPDEPEAGPASVDVSAADLAATIRRLRRALATATVAAVALAVVVIVMFVNWPSDGSVTGDGLGATPTAPTREPDGRTTYRQAYQRQKLRVPAPAVCDGKIPIDVDEPRVKPDTGFAEIDYAHPCESRSTFLELTVGVTGSEIDDAGIKPADCVDRIRTSPLASGAQSVSAGKIYCVLTTSTFAEQDKISRKVVVISVAGVDKGGALTVELSAWDIVG